MGRFGSLIAIALSCLLATCLTAGAARPQATTEADRIFARAVQLHQSGDIEGAVREYQAFLALRPDELAARSNLGAAYARLGRYQEAIEQYQKALAIDDRLVAVRFNLGLAYFKASQVAAAAAELTKVVAAEPGNKNAVLLLADCRLRLGEYKKVIELLAPLETAGPPDRAVAYLLGTALIHDDQPEQGQKLIDLILRDGDSAEARLLMGITYFVANEFASAHKEFQRAVELNPRLPTLHAHLGRTLMALGASEEAKAALRRELELNPADFEANLHLAVLLRQDRKYDEALAHLGRALAARPGAPEVRYQIGSLHLAVGRVTEAQQVLEELVKETPDFVELHVSLATVYYRLKRKADGDRHAAIVQRLNAERQAREPGAQNNPEKKSPPER